MPKTTKAVRYYVAGFLLGGLCGAVQAASIQTFDVPGQVTATYPVSINRGGDLAGYYLDAQYAPHGFVRAASGAITKFDVPGATAGTFPTGINGDGTITGYYWVSAYVPHGFVRSSDGTISTVDLGSDTPTSPSAINSSGATTGYYFPPVTPTSYAIGFIRDPSESTTTFTFPGQGTFPTSINDSGVVTGQVNSQGFVLAANGTGTTFALPGFNTIYPAQVNAAGVIAGQVSNFTCRTTNAGPVCSTKDVTGFVRQPDGTISTFLVPGSQTGGTYVTGINAGNTLTGGYFQGANLFSKHGYMRDSAGNLTLFDVARMKQTDSKAINDSGVIVGNCTDTSNVVHGFIRTP